MVRTPPSPLPPMSRAADFDGDLSGFLREYNYQPDLTAKLDDLEMSEFTQELVNEIVLWKTNRFVQLTNSLLRGIEGVRGLRPGEHRSAEMLIDSLLDIHGVDIRMASTLLRFRNPSVFQIIDEHAYRAVYGSKFPLYTASSRKRKVRVYFDYIDELMKLCTQRKIRFETINRVLYQFDKDRNGEL